MRPTMKSRRKDEVLARHQWAQVQQEEDKRTPFNPVLHSLMRATNYVTSPCDVDGVAYPDERMVPRDCFRLLSSGGGRPRPAELGLRSYPWPNSVCRNGQAGCSL